MKIALLVSYPSEGVKDLESLIQDSSAFFQENKFSIKLAHTQSILLTMYRLSYIENIKTALYLLTGFHGNQ